MEGLAMIDPSFWRGRRVFLTGHTGFKGAWLSVWLSELGADVTGYALEPPTSPSLFDAALVNQRIRSEIGDIRNLKTLEQTLEVSRPEVIIHMAAQPLVRRSYAEPLLTYETNIMGTANLLDAVRRRPEVRAVVVVTTDKCYENKEWFWGYRENEPLGGYDPYSSSKAGAELVCTSYRQSFFNPQEYGKSHATAIASARAGNVIGGGDWAVDRLVPDIMKAIMENRKVVIRSPRAIRPWQHVLEPLVGYLLLAERLFYEGTKFSEAWNFGPRDSDARDVQWIVKRLCALWPGACGFELDATTQPHEATYLKLDCSKAIARLGWQQTWDLETSLNMIIDWFQSFTQGEDMYTTTSSQITAYCKDAGIER